ncbi:hypothetical protein G4X40_19620 [Rhodococcus sp. D2-41]|uniref:DUF6542 domain-containing protein n=1 Tax=Speluncibacter jeojiensis TaxID=2710754 RepID=A0A9X4M3R0_9ACTN|nr:DUF6542 domain-containing protein [Rhodococcus sp. D2-41]MDG3012352.1 hypothetical protein [Rhodococcus sp. D2-41]MDG3014673.1 hypothetical protein [Corynebacteriales bacterium D3-21]
MTATQRARARVPLEQRSIVPTTAGIPWWGGVLCGVAGAFVGYLLDAARGNELTSVFAVFYFLGCVGAVVAVQNRSLFSAMVQPPLILFIGVPLAYETLTTDTGHGLKNLILDLALPLVDRFPMMVFTTIVVLAIGGVRLYLQHQEGSSAGRTASRGAAERRKAARRRETARQRDTSSRRDASARQDLAEDVEPTTGRRRAAEPTTGRRRAADPGSANRRRDPERGRNRTGEFVAADLGPRTGARRVPTEEPRSSRWSRPEIQPRRHAERPAPATSFEPTGIRDDDYRLSDPTVTFPMPARRMGTPSGSPAPAARHPRPRVPLRGGVDPHPTMSTPIPRVRYRDRDEDAPAPRTDSAHGDRPHTNPGWTAPRFRSYEDERPS